MLGCMYTLTVALCEDRVERKSIYSNADQKKIYESYPSLFQAADFKAAHSEWAVAKIM